MKRGYVLWVGLPGIILALAGMLVLSHKQLIWPEAYVSFLDVGQGDATLILTDEGHRVLVDCGNINAPIIDRLREELGYFAGRLDLLVVTHTDQDHFGGCIEVIEHYDVGAVMINGVRREEGSRYEGFLSQVASLYIPIYPGIAGAEINLGERKLHVLHPTKETWGKEGGNDNDMSVVLLATSNTESMLLMADTYTTGEFNIIQRFPDIRANILKVGHHGSDTSTSAEFLDTVQPDIAIISAGKDNSYGHPHQSVLDLLNARDIFVKKTYELIDIDISW